MSLEESSRNLVNGEHLEESDYMIRACIIHGTEIQESHHPGFKRARHVDFWYWHNPEKSAKAIEHAMRESTHSCTISHIDNMNKWSREYRNCTAVVAVGKSRKTGGNISFLTHQDPAFFLQDKPYNWGKIWRSEHFASKLQDTVGRLLDASVPWSVDIVIVWWQSTWTGNFDEYIESILTLDDIIGGVTGEHTTVISGPTLNQKVWDNDKAFYLDTARRRLYLYRQFHQSETLMHFTSEKVREVVDAIKEANQIN